MEQYAFYFQDYQTWCDLRVLETQVDNRYLTHESDDERWEKHRLERNLKTWEEIGQKGVTEIYSFSKFREKQANNNSKVASWYSGCAVSCILYLTLVHLWDAQLIPLASLLMIHTVYRYTCNDSQCVQVQLSVTRLPQNSVYWDCIWSNNVMCLKALQGSSIKF